MNKKELETLVNHKLITEVGYVEDLISNPTKLEEISVENMATMGVLSQPVVNNVLVEDGVISLMPIITQEDLMARIATGKAFKLTNDIQLDTCIILEEGDVCDIDLNGYTITAGVFAESNGAIAEGDSDSYVFWNKGGKLIINGHGFVVAKDAKYSMAVWAQGGTTILNDGSYINAGEGADLIYASAEGDVIINGGYFEACPKQEGVEGTADIRTALNVKDADYKKGTAKIEVFGGEFFEFDPANNKSEGLNTNFVAKGYKSELVGNVYQVVAA